MKIYLAGKIEKNCWRHSVVQGIHWETAEHQPGEPWPILSEAVVGGFDYTGPYFTFCDHGCAHTPAVDHLGRPTVGGLHGLSTEMCGDAPDPQLVRSLCLSAIRRSDLVFAWIHRPDSYGTLVELGFAVGLGIPVVIAYPNWHVVEDMWFLRSCGTDLGDFPEPAAALRYLGTYPHSLPRLVEARRP
jgi:hypothetical protein